MHQKVWRPGYLGPYVRACSMFPQCCRQDDATGCLSFRLLKLSGTSSVNSRFLCDLVSELSPFPPASLLNLGQTRTFQRIKDAVQKHPGSANHCQRRCGESFLKTVCSILDSENGISMRWIPKYEI